MIYIIFMDNSLTKLYSWQTKKNLGMFPKKIAICFTRQDLPFFSDLYLDSVLGLSRKSFYF